MLVILHVDYYMSYFFRSPHPAIAFPSPMTITGIGALSPATAGNLGSRTAISPDEPRHSPSPEPSMLDCQRAPLLE
jgi:hypothetical protein